MTDMFQDLIEIDSFMDAVHLTGAAYVLLLLIVLLVARKVFDLASPYQLAEELTSHDNKAIALSFGGFLFGAGLIVQTVLSHDSHSLPGSTDNAQDSFLFLFDLLSTTLWSFLGIILLLVARFINDKLLLSTFDNTKELVTDRNLGTGAVECGSFVGSAVMIQAALSGSESQFFVSLLATLVFFALGQAGFIAFGLIFQKVARFDLHGEIEKDNVAAGVSFGLNLIAIGVLLSGYLKSADSALGFLIWFVFATLIILACRYFVDKVILPGDLLDEEISRDQNWGAGLVEGLCSIALAIIVTASFF